MRTDLTSSIDSKMKALKVDIDLEIGSQQSKIEQLSDVVHGIATRLDTMESSIASGGLTGNTSIVNQANHDSQFDNTQKYSDEVAVIASNILFEEGEDILAKAQKLVSELDRSVAEHDIISTYRLRSKRSDKPGFVKICFRSVEIKKRILREKHKLRQSTDYRSVYLRSSKSYVERMMELNTRTLLKELPQGAQYRMTANGRLVKKNEDSSLENNQEENGHD
ncbi:unnamed protein product [Mytilus edulis]|uniref:Uncharacterized protein n=1 Tax=Mytilus edulis TaxID=6550 RepID=A0A8S3T7P2_MYTED|nr:unnamed protein product [Mytilus edulis]